MRLLVGLVVVCLSLAAVASGCGGGSDATTRDRVEEVLESKAFKEKTEEILNAPTPEIPAGPPPKKVEFKDVKVGSGPAAERGDRVAINYIGVTYDSDEMFTYHWVPIKPVVYPRLGFGPFSGLEQGIAGMKAGGQREVFVPSRLAGGEGATAYMVKLDSVESEPASSRG
jgi:peptidylprolyl isomerase